MEDLYLKLLIFTLLSFVAQCYHSVGYKHTSSAVLAALAKSFDVKSFFTKELHRSKCHINHFVAFCTPGFSLTHAVNPTMIKSMLLSTHARQDLKLLMSSSRFELNH